MIRVLSGLPPYGPPALSFPKMHAHREGFVLEFTNGDGEAWVANFAMPRSDGFCAVYQEFGPKTVVVVAGGAGYVIDCEERRLLREIDGHIDQCWYQPELHAVVFSDGLGFECFDGDRTLWRSPRVSWDWIRNIDCAGMIVSGEAYDPFSDSWVPMQLDLNEVKLTGGSYPPANNEDDVAIKTSMGPASSA
ncbi:hypothetical protein [Rhizobium sp. BK251]|uniref:hypothetical protein n=1 Tax=Rhizobium sp. BK251 TaxID=2512125 RepID=UPI00104661B6|nr:hypothetical protein [Rhizobium sp. BK251]TCL76074.1 hypothetical protein EV286_101622 [Rhizobium sp. BK251]